MKAATLISIFGLAAIFSGLARAENPAPPPAGKVEKAEKAEPAPELALSIAADASLREVLRDLVQAWADQQEGQPQIELVFSNLGTVSSQLKQKTSWDVVLVADVAEAKALTEKGFLKPDGQKYVAKNDLVVYGRKALITDEEPDWYDLVKSEWKKFAMGHPQLTASGRAAQAAIRKRDVEDRIKESVVTPGSENAALDYARRNEVDAVFIYKTDLTKGKLEGFEAYPVDAGDYPPILYTAAVTAQSAHAPVAQSFIDFLVSESAHPIWTKYGFGGQ